MEALAHQRRFQSLQRIIADLVPDRQTVGSDAIVDLHAIEAGQQLARLVDMLGMAMVETQLTMLARSRLRDESRRPLASLAVTLLVAQLAGLFDIHAAHGRCPLSA